MFLDRNGPLALNGGMKPIQLEDIQSARQKIREQVQLTQLGYSRSFSKWLGTKTYLKFENEQITGSFKFAVRLIKF